jgi:hypothetical protein
MVPWKTSGRTLGNNFQAWKDNITYLHKEMQRLRTTGTPWINNTSGNGYRSTTLFSTCRQKPEHKSQQDVSNQKIRISQVNDKLRWGYSPRGTFTVKESYQILIPPMPDPPDPGWAKLWSLKDLAKDLNLSMVGPS